MPEARRGLKVDRIVQAPHVYTLEGAGVGYRADTALVIVAPAPGAKPVTTTTSAPAPAK